MLKLKWLYRPCNHLPGLSNPSLKGATRDLENKTLRTREKSSLVRQHGIEERNIASLEDNLAASLLQSENSGTLPADKEVIVSRLRNMALRVRHFHRRVLKIQNSDVGQRAHCDIGMETLPAFRLGIVVDNVLACNIMPKVETVPLMNVTC